MATKPLVPPPAGVHPDRGGLGWGWGEKAAEGLIDRSNVALVKNARGAACQGV